MATDTTRTVLDPARMPEAAHEALEDDVRETVERGGSELYGLLIIALCNTHWLLVPWVIFHPVH